MNSWEQRLRAELRSESELIAPGSIRPLDLRGSAGRRASNARAGHGKGWPGWLIPVSAGAAAAAVIAGTVAVSTAVFGNGRRSEPSAVSYTRLPANYAYTVRGNVVSVSRHGGEYSVTANGRYIQVRSTATGRLVATVWPPKPYNNFFSLSGSADGNTFVLGVERFLGFVGLGSPKNLTLDDSAPAKFIMLHITPDGHVHHSLVFLPFTVPPSQYPNIALSPDGTKLAVAYGGGGQTARARVVTLTTGQVRQWQWPHATWRPVLDVQGAWTADDGTVVVQQWVVPRVNRKAPWRYVPADTKIAWLLSTAGSGHSATRRVLRAPAAMSGPGQIFITPDGTKLAATVERGIGSRPFSRYQGQFVMYSAFTGKLVSTVGGWAWNGSHLARNFDTPGIAWSDASGSRLVVLWPYMHVNRLAVLLQGTVALGGNGLFPRSHSAYAELRSSMENAFRLTGGIAW